MYCFNGRKSFLANICSFFSTSPGRETSLRLSFSFAIRLRYVYFTKIKLFLRFGKEIGRDEKGLLALKDRGRVHRPEQLQDTSLVLTLDSGECHNLLFNVSATTIF